MFRILHRETLWNADLICAPDGKTPLCWQIYGYPMGSRDGFKGNHWIPFDSAVQVEASP